MIERVILYDEERSSRIDALLNPESLTWKRRAGVRERVLEEVPIGAGQLAEDTIIYTGGGTTELSLELLFDTRLLPRPPGDEPEAPADVRRLTTPLWALTEPDSASPAAGLRTQRLIWGEWSLPVIATAISERFEDFTAEGIPRRSWIALELRRVNEPRDAALDEAGEAEAEAALAGQIEALTQTGAAETLDQLQDSDLQMPGGSEILRGRADLSAFGLFGDARYWPLVCDMLGVEDPLSATGSELSGNGGAE